MRRVRIVLGAALVLAGPLTAGSFERTAQAKGGECTHTVASGQTLGHIANKHGVSQRNLIDANPELRKNPDMLRVGQELDVCAAKELQAQKDAAAEQKAAIAADSTKEEKKPRKVQSCGSGGQIVEHEVSSGETLSKIIHHYDVTEKELYRRNPDLSRDPKLLRVGQTIKICADQQRVTNSKLCGYRTPLFQHQVVPGENVGQIAGRYGVRRSDLQKWNSRLRKNPDLLSVGQKVSVCPEISPRVREKIAYTVKEGDNLGSIAKRYDLTTRELVRYQRGALDDPSSLRPGQKLTVYVDGDIVPGFGGADDDKGVLKAGVRLPSGKHYQIKWESGAWGTAETIRSIQTAISNYKKKMPGGPKVYIGDISKRGGGPFKPHNSHQHGRDVDVGYVHVGKGESKFRSANATNLDVARTWRLIKSFIDTDQVVYVFVDYKIQELLYEHAKARGASEDLLDELFQYPRRRKRSHGIIRHWEGHTNHFHVRFRK